MDEIVKSGKTCECGGTGPGSHSIDMPLMFNKMLGTKFNVVSGYRARHRSKSPCSGAKSTANAPIGTP